MTLDALDNGGDDSFPNLPRTPEGRLDTTRMPIGTRRQRTSDGRTILVDVEPTVQLTDGRVVRVSEVCPP